MLNLLLGTPGIDVNFRARFTRPALMKARVPAIGAALIAAGADVAAIDRKETALTRAIRKGRRDMVTCTAELELAQRTCPAAVPDIEAALRWVTRRAWIKLSVFVPGSVADKRARVK